MKDRDLNDPTLTIQEEKEIMIEILQQHLRWQMANPLPPEEIPILEVIGPVQKSKRRLVRKLLRKQL
ncbi:Uncharacterised protein [Serratia quinivorans]|uniref:Uncharacterized protein n=1 Tax=Serratia quinivorans TaxID=137545 RepID=A0ABV3ULD8_9GAMM|nr:hypothetical protein [Serratia quinivorans]CAI1574807.1 Uncharacterised protein [Serratia quinivorans]CAI1686321.1 Uncharacterised protein [Serratia quinivorans]CAI1688116.1 Uncharacterised protein [Serratia quinivorans]CAI1732945.1 Uncharacterised protein [Serratia quinivorans]CAI1767636.1 Uncharacterised protein [Serratia quinivorans]